MSGAEVALCVFAKPPREGQVKTRLAAHVGDSVATALAWAFLRDTWSMVKSIAWAQPVLAATENTAEMAQLSGPAPLWVQGPGDLGARMESIAARAFAAGFRAFLAIGADSPGLPSAYLAETATSLQTHDAVLGPTQDGGFYVLGLSRLVPNLLAQLPWSQATTASRTQARLQRLGFQVALAPLWFDVDELDDLRKLQLLLRAGEIDAPHTAAVLATLDLPATS